MTGDAKDMHALLGKTIETPQGTLTIGFLRQEKDAGVGIACGEKGQPEYLVRLSTQKVIRELKRHEDFDKAVLGT